MPAARPRPAGLIDQLNASAPTRAANNALPITAYYRGCDLLLSQAKVYRASGNEEQLYVMLMRFASLVIETIPRHAGFAADAPQYRRFKEGVAAALGELDGLKASLRLRNVDAPAARSTNRPADAALLVTSSLPDIDWRAVGGGAPGALAAGSRGASAAGAAPPGSSDSRFGAEAAEWLARVSSGAAAGTSSGGGVDGGGGGGIRAAAAGAATAAAAAVATAPPAYASAYAPSSQASLDKHALFGPRQGSSSHTSGGGAPRPRYPAFDRTPAAAVDLQWPQQQQQQQPGDASAPSAPPEAALAALALASPNGQGGGGGGGSLLEAPVALRPSLGPALGPQELPVLSMDASLGRPDGTCAALHPPPPPGAASGGGGVRPLAKRAELRDVHVSVALMNDFLRYAAANTRRGIESCGILAGTLSAGDSIFTVTTLIVPKQEGTSDTVAALNEEEIYEAQASRELYPLGWIHTHPTQTCFLSSVDVHTQCGYQTMLDEAVAIVMAPTDARNRCGIFRLTTPGGLALVQKCPLRGFHPHPATGTGQEVYELCGHVYLNPRVKHDVLDLR